MCAITDEKNAKVTNISEDSNDHKELFDEDEGIDEDDDESSGMTSSMARCKWADCNMEFNDMEFLVAHINNCHIQARRGSEEYPCFWKVICLDYVVEMFTNKLFSRIAVVNTSHSMPSTNS